LFTSLPSGEYNGRLATDNQKFRQIEKEMFPMQRQMIISVLSKDRPGIIADITGAIFELNGDLADLSQSILCGYLTMTLIVTFDRDLTTDAVYGKLAAIKSKNGYEIIVKSMDLPLQESNDGLPEKTYILTVQGKNKSGMVYSISSFCYQRDINILDLSTTLKDDQYTMVLQLDLSKVTSIKQVREDLDLHAQKNEINIMMQHYDIFRVTNEVTLI
jgi:glycine cleavage system transcriptional repressor